MKANIIRKLDKPYFLLRTHDRIGHFLQPQMERMFFLGEHGLGRFLPSAKIVEVDGVKAVKYTLTKGQQKTLRPMKFITHPELCALRKAVSSFLSPQEKLTKYETELRKSFRLPDPELEPESYLLWGSKRNPKLLILWGVEYTPGTSLPIISTNENGRVDSICSKLARKVVRRTKEWVGTAAICSMIFLGAGSFFLMKDTSAPEVLSVSSTNNPKIVTVIFDEEINFSSLGPESFKLRNTAHVLTPKFDGSNPNKVVLELEEPLNDRKDYFLDFGLTQKPMDLAGNEVGDNQKIKSERQREFRFEDLEAPKIVEVEPLPPNSLIVRFNEAVSLRSVLRPSTFWLSEFTLLDAVLEENFQQSVTLIFEEPLVHNGSYLLEVKGLEDDSEYRNQLHENVEFRYLDTFGPDLISTIPGENQSEIILLFDECLEPESALKTENYEVEGMDVFSVSPYKPYEDHTLGKNSFKAVRLVTTPLSSHKDYQISVSAVGDRMNPPNLMDKQSVTYSYRGNLDRTPPFVSKAKGNGDKLLLVFSEILDQNALAKDSFKIEELRSGRNMRIGALEFEVRDDCSLVTLQLESEQIPGQMYRIAVTECKDSSGNAAHLDHLYKARGIFREPIAIDASSEIQSGQSVVGFKLPKGVLWETNSIKNIQAYGISIQGSKAIEVEQVSYEVTSNGAEVRLSLQQPLEENGRYQFFLEGAKLADGSVVERPYHGSIQVGV